MGHFLNFHEMKYRFSGRTWIIYSQYNHMCVWTRKNRGERERVRKSEKEREGDQERQRLKEREKVGERERKRERERKKERKRKE